MKAQRFLAVVFVALVLVGCAPMASAPVGRNQTRICGWVRDQVANGSLPVQLAWEWYEHCAPFEVPR